MEKKTKLKPVLKQDGLNKYVNTDITSFLSDNYILG